MEAKTSILTWGDLFSSFVLLVNVLLACCLVDLGIPCSFQVQEYVEAATFYKFCRTGTLLHLEEINSTLLPLSDPSLEPLQINVLDYLLGVIYSILNCTSAKVCLSGHK